MKSNCQKFLIVFIFLTLVMDCSSSNQNRSLFQDKGYFLAEIVKRKTDGIVIVGLEVKIIKDKDEIEKIKSIDNRSFDIRYDKKDKKWYFAMIEPPAYQVSGKAIRVGNIHRFYYYDKGFFPREELIYIESVN